MSDEVDYKAIAEQLQRDLEIARLTIVKMRFARNPLTRVKADTVREFVAKNYLVILVAIMLFSFILSSLKTIRGLFHS